MGQHEVDTNIVAQYRNERIILLRYLFGIKNNCPTPDQLTTREFLTKLDWDQPTFSRAQKRLIQDGHIRYSLLIGIRNIFKCGLICILRITDTGEKYLEDFLLDSKDVVPQNSLTVTGGFINNLSQGNHNSTEQVAIDSRTIPLQPLEIHIPQLENSNVKLSELRDDHDVFAELVADITSKLESQGYLEQVAKRYIARLKSASVTPNEIAELTKVTANDNGSYRDALAKFVSEHSSGAGTHWLVRAVERGLMVKNHYI